MHSHRISDMGQIYAVRLQDHKYNLIVQLSYLPCRSLPTYGLQEQQWLVEQWSTVGSNNALAIPDMHAAMVLTRAARFIQLGRQQWATNPAGSAVGRRWEVPVRRHL